MPATASGSHKSMTGAERFESIMHLAEFHDGRWKTKNATEWRVAFATWAVLLASPIYIRPRPDDLILISAALIAFSLGYCLFWAFFIARKNHFEVHLSFYYRDMAEKLALGVASPAFCSAKKWHELDPSEKRRFSRDVVKSAAFWFQSLTTVSIAYLVYRLMGQIVLRP